MHATGLRVGRSMRYRAPTEHDPDTFNIIVAIAARGDTPVPNTLVAERTITAYARASGPGGGGRPVRSAQSGKGTTRSEPVRLDSNGAPSASRRLTSLAQKVLRE
jgi:hypothetical protein